MPILDVDILQEAEERARYVNCNNGPGSKGLGPSSLGSLGPRLSLQLGNSQCSGELQTWRSGTVHMNVHLVSRQQN